MTQVCTEHAISLQLQAGDVLEFTATESETVLEAAARAGWILPALCKEGGCGSCRAHCASGDYEQASYSSAALSAEDAAHGAVLLCRTSPRADLQLQAPFSRQAVSQNAPTERQAEITSIESLGGDTMRLSLLLKPDADGNQAAEFEPGQYMQLAIPGTEAWRAYSIASLPNWTGELAFLIRLQPNGAFSHWLKSDAAVGDVIRLRSAQGHFTLQENGFRPRWFVGGGTGLAPLLSMLSRMAEWQDPQPVRLYFGVNDEQALFDLSAVEALQASLSSLQIEVVVWHPSDAWTGRRGTPAEALAADLPTVSEAPDLYLCGPAALIETCTQAAVAAGVPLAQVFSERFLPSGT